MAGFKTSASLAYLNSSNANFQAWAGMIHNALISGGWIDTLDTGSTDPTSATAPANGSYIFKVYKMGDTLQATSPCFMKIRYGSSGASLQASMGVTLGTATNGSGTLTNATTEILSAGATIFASSAVCYVSTDTNRFSCAMFTTATNNSTSFSFQVERSHDNTGADDTVLPYVFIWGTLGTITNGWRGQCIFPDNTQTVQEILNFGFALPTQSTFKGNSFFSPVVPQIGMVGNAIIAGYAKTADLGLASVGQTTTFSVSFYGTSHTLIAFHTGIASGICIRWET